MLDVSEWGRLLLYSTQRGGVHALDHRAGCDAWVLPAKARQVEQKPSSLCHQYSREQGLLLKRVWPLSAEVNSVCFTHGPAKAARWLEDTGR